ncbi:MAG: GNAT family N-acetyltransferase [Clostridia bacterium]|nr:GNAT family N-acetyltransferase [Clostridia bacterium]
MELQIRKMIPKDFKPLHKLLSDPGVMKYLEPPFSAEQTKSFLQEAGLSDPPLVYSVVLQGRFIGYAIYHPYDEDAMEIGWVLLPEYWGRGFAGEITKMLIEKAKKEKKNAVIECVPQQTASKRIAEKNGFVYCGRTDGLDVFRWNYST